jgi:hypothetical protein
VNKETAKKLFATEGFKFLRWDPTFTRALVKTPAGVDAWVHRDGDIAKMKARLAKLKNAPVAQADADKTLST